MVERTPFVYGGVAIPVTVSVGFAVAEPDSRADYKRMKLLASATVHEAKERMAGAGIPVRP